VESSPGIFADTVSFCWHSVFCWISSLLLTRQIFCWYSIFFKRHHQRFLRTYQILLTQHIFPESADFFAETANFCLLVIFYWIIIRHFADSASFCWHSVFLLNQIIFADWSYFLLIQQHIFAESSGIFADSSNFADTACLSWISWFFAGTANFCWLVKFFADTGAYFCWYRSMFLLSHHQVFCGLIKFCWHSMFFLNQLIFFLLWR